MRYNLTRSVRQCFPCIFFKTDEEKWFLPISNNLTLLLGFIMPLFLILSFAFIVPPILKVNTLLDENANFGRRNLDISSGSCTRRRRVWRSWWRWWGCPPGCTGSDHHYQCHCHNCHCCHHDHDHGNQTWYAYLVHFLEARWNVTWQSSASQR